MSDLEITPPVGQLDNRLLAARARAEILEAIFAGRFETKLPNEDRLAGMLNVSRTTVRTAMQGLERDGVVTRRRAIGTIVNPHVSRSSLALQRLVGFDWLLQERGHDVDVTTSVSESTIGELLGLGFAADPAATCLAIEKLYRADGDLALVIVDGVLSTELLDDEVPEAVPPSLFAFSQTYCHDAIHHAVVKIVPQVRTRGGDSKLEVPAGSAFVRLNETHYVSDGRAIAFSRIDVDDRFIQLEVVRSQ